MGRHAEKPSVATHAKNLAGELFHDLGITHEPGSGRHNVDGSGPHWLEPLTVEEEAGDV